MTKRYKKRIYHKDVKNKIIEITSKWHINGKRDFTQIELLNKLKDDYEIKIPYRSLTNHIEIMCNEGILKKIDRGKYQIKKPLDSHLIGLNYLEELFKEAEGGFFISPENAVLGIDFKESQKEFWEKCWIEIQEISNKITDSKIINLYTELFMEWGIANKNKNINQYTKLLWLWEIMKSIERLVSEYHQHKGLVESNLMSKHSIYSYSMKLKWLGESNDWTETTSDLKDFPFPSKTTAKIDKVLNKEDRGRLIGGFMPFRFISAIYGTDDYKTVKKIYWALCEKYLKPEDMDKFLPTLKKIKNLYSTYIIFNPLSLASRETIVSLQEFMGKTFFNNAPCPQISLDKEKMKKKFEEILKSQEADQIEDRIDYVAWVHRPDRDLIERFFHAPKTMDKKARKKRIKKSK